VEQWSSKIGFLFAAIGSAVGIGNIWRFSAVVGQNGGGAYLIPYLIAVFLFAMPLMILELAMGRYFRATVVSAYRNVRPRFYVIGWLLCAILFIVLSYYLVITGWTLGYVVISATGEMTSFAQFTGSYQPVLFFTLVTLATGTVVSIGVQKGIEKISMVMIPICVVILIGMAIIVTTLPGFAAGMQFFLTPDFSVLSDPLIWSAAFGQAFFSLSVGGGILLTYGSYVASEEKIPRSALIITLTDLFVALLAGAVIFPIVFSFGFAPTIGAELAFSTLPKAFAQMPGGQIISVAFFFVLFFAALTSSISMLEVNVAAVREALGWTRLRTALFLSLGILIVGMPSALSYSAVNLTVTGVRVLDYLDETVGTLGLPIAALLTAVTFTWFLHRSVLESQIDGTGGVTRFVLPLCKFVIPAVLIVTMALRLLAGVDFPGMRFIPGTEFIGTPAQFAGIAVILALITANIVIICRVWSCTLPPWLRGWR
jgi:NSS family neurotransmitter:Na+ symporter